VEDVDGYLLPVAHALVQAREDIERLRTSVPADRVWMRPGGVASVGFHIQHVGGVVDRLFTYARGEALSEAQKATLKAESAPPDPPPSLDEIAGAAVASIDRGLAQLRATPAAHLLEERRVGRAQLPSTVLGLLFHAGEHATRHIAQANTTARVLAGT
jgi:hypothetical protein